jgi:hypothetical protein
MVYFASCHEPTKLSSRAALLDNFGPRAGGISCRTRGDRGPGAGSRFPNCRSTVKLVVATSAERQTLGAMHHHEASGCLDRSVERRQHWTGEPETANVGLHHRPRTQNRRCEVWCAHGRAHGGCAGKVSAIRPRSVDAAVFGLLWLTLRQSLRNCPQLPLFTCDECSVSVDFTNTSCPGGKRQLAMLRIIHEPNSMLRKILVGQHSYVFR